MSVCRVIVGAGDADGLGDPFPDPLDDGLGDPSPDPLDDGLASPEAWDASAEGGEAAVLLVLLAETHPTMVMIAMRASGGAAIKKGVRRQKGFGP
jgi:hypothetical protein